MRPDPRTIAGTWFQKGFEQGRKISRINARKGGWEEELAEAIQLCDMQENVLILGQSKFDYPCSRVEKTISSITDLTQLQRLLLTIPEVESWEELLSCQK